MDAHVVDLDLVALLCLEGTVGRFIGNINLKLRRRVDRRHNQSKKKYRDPVQEMHVEPPDVTGAG